MNQSLATDVFRQRLEEARAATLTEGFPMVFAGFPCKVRPLTPIHFINAGRMPDHLTRRLLATLQGGASGDGVEESETTPEQIVEGEVFMRKAVCAVMIEPRVVESEPVPEGGYLYADLMDTAPDFPTAVFQWVMRNCPRPTPEEGGGGEMLGVETLENFPGGTGRPAGADAGDKGKGGRAPAGRSSARPRRKRVGRK